MRQMDVAIGKVVYTPVLTPSGGFKTDLTIMRLGEEQFRVVTGGAHGMADLKWFADHLPADGSAQITDLTSAWMHARPLGAARARHPREPDGRRRVARGFPFATCRTIEIGPLRVLASRISYVGDLGWELYVPIEQGAQLWDLVWEAGEPHGVVPAGIGVYGTTGRLEKCYRAFGFELDARVRRRRGRHGVGQGEGRRTSSARRRTSRHRESEPAAVLCTLTVDDHTRPTG